jgi:dynein heavy chain
MAEFVGHVQYGGQVADERDRGCLLAMAKVVFNEKVLQPDYRYSESGLYYSPLLPNLDEYRSFIEKLPYRDEPEAFGLPPAVALAYEAHESAELHRTLRQVLPSPLVPYPPNVHLLGNPKKVMRAC